MQTQNRNPYHAVSFSIPFPDDAKKMADITAVFFLPKHGQIDIRINSIKHEDREAADIVQSGLWDTTFYRESPLWKRCEELAEAANAFPKDQWLPKLGITIRKLFLKTRAKEVILIHNQGMVVTCHYGASSVSTEVNPARVEIMSELTGYTIGDVYIGRLQDNWHFNEAYDIIEDPAYELGNKFGFDCPYCWTKDFYNMSKPLVLTDYFSPAKDDGKPTDIERLTAIKMESVATALEAHPDDYAAPF